MNDPNGRTGHRERLRAEPLGPGASAGLVFKGRIDGSALWDAEHPNLHTLTLVLRAGDRRLETVVRRVGFREIEIAGTRLFVNGRPVKLRGVNRHEVHPLRGRSLTPELWRRDAELFRAANMNYIRTSHYPPAEEFLDACDEKGLFVECEAPLVWVQHGANETWKTENPQDPKYLPAIRQAVAETVAFNRLHPSILFWSLANESGWSPHLRPGRGDGQGHGPDPAEELPRPGLRRLQQPRLGRAADRQLSLSRAPGPGPGRLAAAAPAPSLRRVLPSQLL
ncbi:MAG: hypothetical protein MZV64_43560 [Ignavibacteriales bacterium]|nr:hypothetical protein [Ignavibacteriales bacterium]